MIKNSLISLFLFLFYQTANAQIDSLIHSRIYKAVYLNVVTYMVMSEHNSVGMDSAFVERVFLDCKHELSLGLTKSNETTPIPNVDLYEVSLGLVRNKETGNFNLLPIWGNASSIDKLFGLIGYDTIAQKVIFISGPFILDDVSKYYIRQGQTNAEKKNALFLLITHRYFNLKPDKIDIRKKRFSFYSQRLKQMFTYSHKRLITPD